MLVGLFFLLALFVGFASVGLCADDGALDYGTADDREAVLAYCDGEHWTARATVALERLSIAALVALLVSVLPRRPRLFRVAFLFAALILAAYVYILASIPS